MVLRDSPASGMARLSSFRQGVSNQYWMRKGVHLQVGVPELDLEVSTGTLGGLITTVEGLLDTIAQNLKNTQVQPHPCQEAMHSARRLPAYCCLWRIAVFSRCTTQQKLITASHLQSPHSAHVSQRVQDLR